jgi:hypothetical protein
VVAGVATPAGCGVLGMAPAAALAGSASVPAWTQQHPATGPPKESASMAYDAATGTVVLVGENFADTWTRG